MLNLITRKTNAGFDTRRTSVRSSLAVMLAPLLLLSSFVHAQLEEIIVTAQKREQLISDVPISISAFSGAKLDEFNIQQFDDLANFVPGLEVQEQSANNPAFVIRGITSDSGEANIEPRIAIFQDGVPSSRSRGSFFELHDLERVEVVKGPQSTLFGRAALIGGLNVIQAKPEYEWQGQVKAAYGQSVRDTEYVEFSGNIGGPIIADKLAFRIAFIDKELDPYVEDLLGGPGFNGADVGAYRLSFRADFSEKLRLDLIVNKQRDTPPGTGFKSNRFAPENGDTSPFSAAALRNFGGFRGREADELGLVRDMETLTAIAAWTINDQWSLTLISGYREFDSEEVFDADGSFHDILTVAEVATGEQFSQEVRLNYDDGGKLSMFFGANFLDEEGQQYVPLATDTNIGIPFFVEFLATGEGSEPTNESSGVLYREEFANSSETESFDVFWDATYRFTEKFNFTVGVRATKDNKRTGYFGRSLPVSGGPVLLPVGQDPGNTIFIAASEGGEPQSASDSFIGYSWRFVAAYEFNDDLNVWASYARGRRPEVIAFNTPEGEDFVQPTTLEAEELDSIEFGGFSSFWDGVVTFNGSVFYYEYTNFQTTIFVAGQAAVEALNAGSASSHGLEAQFDIKAMENLGVFVSYGYNRGRFDKKGESGVEQEFGGNQFRLSPDHSLAIGATWSLPMEAGTFLITPTYNFKSEVFFDDDNDRPDLQEFDDTQDEVQPSYGLLNVSARFEAANGFYVAELFGKNVLDEDYLLDGGNTGDGFGLPTFIPGPDRLWGLSLTARF